MAIAGAPIMITLVGVLMLVKVAATLFTKPSHTTEFVVSSAFLLVDWRLKGRRELLDLTSAYLGCRPSWLPDIHSVRLHCGASRSFLPVSQRLNW
jgi:hypothetical protein